MSKEEALALIHKVMRENNLNINEVTEYVLKHAKPEKYSDIPHQNNEFDILCLVDGKKMRVPFALKDMGTALGIFPFKDEPWYIELEEVNNRRHIDSDVDEDRLLDEAFCCRVYKIKNRLNLYLKALGKPILEGVYLADSNYMRGCGWIIGFDDNDTGNLSSDYYGGSEPAKCRYMGRFENKQRKLWKQLKNFAG